MIGFSFFRAVLASASETFSWMKVQVDGQVPRSCALKQRVLPLVGNRSSCLMFDFVHIMQTCGRLSNASKTGLSAALMMG